MDAMNDKLDVSDVCVIKYEKVLSIFLSIGPSVFR